MRLFYATAICAVTASQALALCAPESTIVLSCTTNGGTDHLDVCISGDSVTYRYGPESAPDLTLMTIVARLEHQPWPGIGRAIWEAATFRNGAFSYEVYSSYDKFDQISDGGVTVYQQDNEVASLACDAGSVKLGLFAIGDAKEAAGQCWDPEAQIWGQC